MKTVARFVTRLQGDGDGLFVGALFQSGMDMFKPNTVYELREVLGELTVVEVGQGIGAGSNNCISNAMSEGKNPFHWADDIGNIIGSQGKHMFLTMEEYNHYVNEQRKHFADFDN